MDYKRILTIQDISCIGQCSLTVALPILSACGMETCVLPSAVLSTHTGGKFSGYTFRDLTDDIMPICRHWEKENIKFDALYTGYLGSKKQIDYTTYIIDNYLNENKVIVVDPAMADNGRLYSGFNSDYVDYMRKLCTCADIILPNVTEACLLTDTKYCDDYDEKYITDIVEKLEKFGMKTIVLTGVSFDKESTGVYVLCDGKTRYYRHILHPLVTHGTGDIYSSVFTGTFLRGKSVFESAKIAAEFTLKCIENTKDDKEHWYGVKFEPLIGELIKMIG